VNKDGAFTSAKIAVEEEEPVPEEESIPEEEPVPEEDETPRGPWLEKAGSTL